VIDKISHTHKKKLEIMVLYIQSFDSLWVRQFRGWTLVEAG